MLAIQTEELGRVRISKELTLKLRNLSRKAGFNSPDEYAAFIMKCVLDEVEEAKLFAENGPETSYTEEEILEIKEELRPLVLISC
jgi:hypothetical protein